jgi:hypothetical protein
MAQEKVGKVGRVEGATVLVMTDAIMSDPELAVCHR